MRNARARRRDDSREARRKSSVSRESSEPRRSHQKRGRSHSRDEKSPRGKSSKNRGVSASPKRDGRGRERSVSRSASRDQSHPRREDAKGDPARKAEEPAKSSTNAPPPPQEQQPPEPPSFVDPRVNMDGCAEDMNFVEEIDISQLPDGTLLEDFMMLEDGTMLADASFFAEDGSAIQPPDAYDPEEAVQGETQDFWKRNQEQPPEVRVTEEALALALTGQPSGDEPDSHGHCTVGKWTTVALKSIKDHDARLRPDDNQLEPAKKNQGNEEDDQWKSFVRWNSRSRSRDDDKEKGKQPKKELTDIPPPEEKDKEKEKDRDRTRRPAERGTSKPRRSGDRDRSRGRRSRSRGRRRRSGSRHKRAKRTSFNFGEAANPDAAENQISAKLSGFGRGGGGGGGGGGFDQQLAPLEQSKSGFGRTEIKLTQVQIRCLLGKGGACVQSIMRQTGAQIVVRTPPSSHLGIVTISGNHKPAMAAIEQVLIQKGCPMDTINDQGISHGPGVVEVPERLVGRLVGKTSFFATVQEQLGEDTVIQKLPHMSPSGGRYVQVAGENWLQAKQMVMQWVDGQKTRPQAGLPPLMTPGMTPGMMSGAMTPRPVGTPAMSGVTTPMLSGFATPLPGTMTPSQGISL